MTDPHPFSPGQQRFLALPAELVEQAHEVDRGRARGGRLLGSAEAVEPSGATAHRGDPAPEGFQAPD